MTDRERWTVYPLLFLALGVGLRSSGKFGPTKEISCHRLLIQGPDGKVQMELSAAPDANGGGGMLKVLSDYGRTGVELRAAPQGGIIQAVGPNGLPQVLLESTQIGGALATFAPDRTPLFVAEPTPLGVAITAFGYRGRAQQPLNIPWNRFRLPSGKKRPEAETPGSEPIPAEPQQPAQGEPSEAGPDATQPAPPRDDSGDNAGTKDVGGPDESTTPNEHD